MDTTRRATVFAFGIALILGSCGPRGGGGSGSGSVPADEFWGKTQNTALESICEGIWECPEKHGPDVLQTASRFGDLESCKSGVKKILTVDGSILQEDVDQGLVEYDEEKAGECLDAIEEFYDENPCVSTLRMSFPACREATTGTQENGEPCYRANHCKSNNCNLQAGDTETCYGECGPARTEVGAGEPCGSESQNTCKLDSNLVCYYGSDTSSATCRKPRSVAEGEPCFESRVCEGSLTCFDGTCQSVTLKAEGESCNPNDSTVLCEPGLVCRISYSNESGVSGTCESPASEGDSCYLSLECEYSLYCEGSKLEVEGAPEQGACAPRKEAGESCSNFEECKPNLSCNEGMCTEGSSGSQCELPSETNGGGGDAGGAG